MTAIDAKAKDAVNAVLRSVTGPTQAVHEFTDAEKQEIRLIEQHVLRAKLQLVDIELHVQALTAQKAQAVKEIQDGNQRLIDRVQLIMRGRLGLDPDSRDQRFDVNMQKLELTQTFLAPPQ